MLAMIVRRQLGSVHALAAVVLALYLVDETTAVHTTSGLETQLFVALLWVAYWQALKFVESPGLLRGTWLAVASFLGLLCRPEGALYGAALYAVLSLYAGRRWRDSAAARDMVRPLALSTALLMVFVLLYAAWKQRYFGYLLPNPYYVKSDRLSLAGLPDVLSFLLHVVLWYGPLVLGVGYLAFRQGLLAPLREVMRPNVLLILAPPSCALLYYVTIVHETGGAYRFSYPTYAYLVLAAAVFLGTVMRSLRQPQLHGLGLVAPALLYLFILITHQGSWHLTARPRSDFNQFFFKIGDALKETGIGSRGTVLCNAAGIIPYVSGFNHIDPVGLTDNFLSSRQPITFEERERYMRNSRPDVYLGSEPPAGASARRPEDDPLMRSPYVTHVLERSGVTHGWDRIVLRDPSLLHSRMRDLRDNWHWLGEVEWPGWRLWRLKRFLYVRKGSPYADVLVSALRKVVTVEPGDVDLQHLEAPAAPAQRDPFRPPAP